MSNTSNLVHRELTDAELDAVSGGSGGHFDTVELTVGGYGSAVTPASAWNACLGVFGYSPQA